VSGRPGRAATLSHKEIGMFKRMFALSIGTVAFAATAALAAGPAHPANTETGTVYHGAEYSTVDGRVVRVDTWNSPAAATPRNASNAWEYLGEESGWVLRQHSYELRNGRLVHSDTLPHDTPKPAPGRELLSTGSGS
jgi:hypothetical protein